MFVFVWKKISLSEHPIVSCMLSYKMFYFFSLFLNQCKFHFVRHYRHSSFWNITQSNTQHDKWEYSLLIGHKTCSMWGEGKTTTRKRRACCGTQGRSLLLLVNSVPCCSYWSMVQFLPTQSFKNSPKCLSLLIYMTSPLFNNMSRSILWQCKM